MNLKNYKASLFIILLLCRQTSLECAGVVRSPSRSPLLPGERDRPGALNRIMQGGALLVAAGPAHKEAQLRPRVKFQHPRSAAAPEEVGGKVQEPNSKTAQQDTDRKATSALYYEITSKYAEARRQKRAAMQARFHKGGDYSDKEMASIIRCSHFFMARECLEKSLIAQTISNHPAAAHNRALYLEILEKVRKEQEEKSIAEVMELRRQLAPLLKNNNPQSVVNDAINALSKATAASLKVRLQLQREFTMMRQEMALLATLQEKKQALAQRAKALVEEDQLVQTASAFQADVNCYTQQPLRAVEYTNTLLKTTAEIWRIPEAPR